MKTSKRISGAGHLTPSMQKKLKAKRVNRCFGCGPANPHGMKLRFRLDFATGTTHARVRLARRYEGPPGHIHGGIIATLLDEAMGKVNKIYETVAMTRHMEIDYLRPSPLGQWLTVTGRRVRREGRKMFMEGEIRDAAGELLARSRGLFIEFDPAAMFARHPGLLRQTACPIAIAPPKAKRATPRTAKAAPKRG